MVFLYSPGKKPGVFGRGCGGLLKERSPSIIISVCAQRPIAPWPIGINFSMKTSVIIAPVSTMRGYYRYLNQSVQYLQSQVSRNRFKNFSLLVKARSCCLLLGSTHTTLVISCGSAGYGLPLTILAVKPI